MTTGSTRSSLYGLRPAFFVLSLSLAGCALGPDYQRPELIVAPAFKHQNGWIVAKPADHVERGAWWSVFNDATLNQLLEKLTINNQNLAASEAQYRQAQALVGSAKAGFWPTVGTSLGTVRSGNQANTATDYNASLNAAWELDLWGKLRRNLEANQANYEASSAELASLRLSLQGSLVQNYIQLRVLDEQARFLEQSIQAYERSLTLTTNQYNAGIAPKSDTTQATTQLRSTQAQKVDLQWQRAQIEHAIAVLIGATPMEFSLLAQAGIPDLPAIPQQVPAQLLERRPDIAAAERRVMAANAHIGVAKAAWFPDLTLSASGGYRSSSFADWISLPNRVWSVGPQLALSLFDGGTRRADLQRADAAYDQTVAVYRQTVLESFQEVEDALVQIDVFTQEQRLQQQALEAANESLRLIENQYKAGMLDYLSVVQSQTTQLSNERTLLNLRGNQLLASVKLMTALGGGWDESKP